MPTTTLTQATDLTQAVLAETGEYRYFSLEGQSLQAQASSPAVYGSSSTVADGADPSMTMGEFLAVVGPEGAGDLQALPALSPAVKPCPGAPMKSGQSSRMGGLTPRTLFNSTQ